jgi:hypothetical protein
MRAFSVVSLAVIIASACSASPAVKLVNVIRKPNCQFMRDKKPITQQELDRLIEASAIGRIKLGILEEPTNGGSPKCAPLKIGIVNTRE